jgi:DNA-binding response OmpR family regulator
LHVSPAADVNAHSAGKEQPRRALVFAADDGLLARLASAGYEVQTGAADKALRAVSEFAPDLLLVELHAGTTARAGIDGLALAASLRAAPQTHALPLVLLFHTDDAAQRQAAQRLGADDYFAVGASIIELRARLEALLWRNAASRRAVALDAAAVGAEIDDFMQLLDTTRADIEAGAHGALALVAAAPDEAQANTQESAPRERTLAAAHDFFKLNLRRLDLVAFYGPDMLLVYLPRRGPGTASSTLARVRNEFVAAHTGARLSVGLATFPADGREVEILLERAEARFEVLPGTASATSGTAAVAPEANAARASESADAAHASESVAPAENVPTLASASGATVLEQTGAHVGAQTGEVENAPALPASELAEASERRRARPVRESRQPDALEAAVMPAAIDARYGAGQALARAALEAAGRERERRARGASMPRRLLLTVSDAARMAQVNLLLRSAGYEVRAAFDAHQALNLLRIERPDLLVLDYDLHGLNGLETMRRLAEQHQGRLPLPVVLFLPAQAQGEEVRAEARALGACGFVSLPYEPGALLDAVRMTGTPDEKE